MERSLFEVAVVGLLPGLLLFDYDSEVADSKYDSTSSSVIFLSDIVVASQIPFHRSLKINVFFIFLYHSL
jgi:hypothetical protein